MSASENAEIVRNGYQAFATGDLPTVMGQLSPDIVWHIPGENALSGDYRGHDEVMAFFGKLATETGGTFQLTVEDLLASDEHVVALCHQNLSRSGQTLDGDIVHVWRVADGKAAEFWGMPYDAVATDAFWKNTA
jgi:uncharacterized protein